MDNCENKSMKRKIFPKLVICLLFLATPASYAGSATWKSNPTSSDWNTASNWTPETVPNGPSDVATFSVSNVTTVTFSAQFTTEVNSIVFGSGASAFTITPVDSLSHLTISGAGVINNSGIVQNFGNSIHVQSVPFIIEGNATIGQLVTFNESFSFESDASAGDGTFVLANDALNSSFFSGTTAGNGTFEFSSSLFFWANSTAGNATFTIGSEPNNIVGGFLGFNDSSSAENATFTVNGGTTPELNGEGNLAFTNDSSAANATLIANGGTNGGKGGGIGFSNQATGGTAKIKVFGNGNLDISEMHLSALTIGSLEGDGAVFLGRNTLSIGSNSLSTLVSGIIQDGGLNGGAGGSLTKIGNGTLTLTGSNTYTGGTVLKSGILLINNTQGSGTGSGPVQASLGTFGGSGRVLGNVTVGTGAGSGAILAPGSRGVVPGTLRIAKTLTLKTDATYNVLFDSSLPAADKVVARGVRIVHSSIVFADRVNSVLPPGTTFTIIDNRAATAIAGRFNNLEDNSIVTIGSNTYLASYEGGDGNDLTLTVVP